MNLTLCGAAMVVAGFLLVLGCKKDEKADTPASSTCNIEQSSLLEERIYNGDNLNYTYEFYHDGKNRLSDVKNGSDNYEIAYLAKDTVEIHLKNMQFCKEWWYYNSDHFITSGLRKQWFNMDTATLQYQLHYTNDNKLKSITIHYINENRLDSLNLIWLDGNITAKEYYNNSQLMHSEFYRYYSDKPGTQHLSFLNYVQTNRQSFLYFPFTYYTPLATKNLLKDVRQIIPDLDTSIVIEYSKPIYDDYGRLSSIEPTYTLYYYGIDTVTNQIGMWPYSESYRNEYIFECR